MRTNATFSPLYYSLKQ